MLRIASFTLPLKANDGGDLDAEHSRIRFLLASVFGGYTAIPCQGGWKNDNGEIQHESNWLYNVAIPDEFEARSTFRGIACYAGALAKQDAMFLTFPGGDCEIVPSENYWADGETRKLLAADQHSARIAANSPWQ